MRTTKKVVIIMAVMALIAGSMAGCATNKKFVTRTYQAVETLTHAANEAITAVEEMWKAGLISDEDARRAKDIYTKYYMTQQAIVVALAEYKALDNKLDQEAREATIRDALEMLLDLSAELTGLLTEFGLRGESESIKEETRTVEWYALSTIN